MEDSSSLRPSTSSKPSRQDGEAGGVLAVWQELCLEEGVQVCPGVSLLKIQPTRKTSKLLASQDKEEDQSQTELKVSFLGEGRTMNALQVVGPFFELGISSALMKLISLYPSLTNLNLTNCQLRAEGVLMLSWGLKQASITDLCLDSNPISGQDYSSLLLNNNLQFLSLRTCKIENRGAELLAKALADDNCHLIFLNLDTNLIQSEGAVHLANAVKWNSHLVILCLAGNRVDLEGGRAFVAALLSSPLDQDALIRLHKARLKYAQAIARNVYEKKAELAESMHGSEQWSDELVKEKKLNHSLISKSSGKRDKRKSTVALTKGKESRKKTKRTSSAISMAANSDQIRERSVEKLTVPVPSCFVDQDNESQADYEALLTDLDDESEENDFRLEDFLLEKLVDKIEMDSEDQKPSILKRIQLSEDGSQITWPGNETLAYLNLAYNGLKEENAQGFVEVLKYQEKIGLKKSGKGLRYLLLKENKIPVNSPSLVEIKNFVITELGESRT